jgi:hypothetical protein
MLSDAPLISNSAACVAYPTFAEQVCTISDKFASGEPNAHVLLNCPHQPRDLPVRPGDRVTDKYEVERSNTEIQGGCLVPATIF